MLEKKNKREEIIWWLFASADERSQKSKPHLLTRAFLKVLVLEWLSNICT